MFESVSSPVSAEPLSTGTGPREEPFQPQAESAIAAKDKMIQDPVFQGLVEIANGRGYPDSDGKNFAAAYAANIGLAKFMFANGLDSRRQAAQVVTENRNNEFDQLKSMASEEANPNPQPMFR
jgi:hypothetical protein